jgi:hypothetical protein
MGLSIGGVRCLGNGHLCFPGLAHRQPSPIKTFEDLNHDVERGTLTSRWADGGPYLASRLVGDDAAKLIQRGIEYEPQPPFGPIDWEPPIVEALRPIWRGPLPTCSLPTPIFRATPASAWSRDEAVSPAGAGRSSAIVLR